MFKKPCEFRSAFYFSEFPACFNRYIFLDWRDLKLKQKGSYGIP